MEILLLQQIEGLLPNFDGGDAMLLETVEGRECMPLEGDDIFHGSVLFHELIDKGIDDSGTLSMQCDVVPEAKVDAQPRHYIIFEIAQISVELEGIVREFKAADHEHVFEFVLVCIVQNELLIRGG